MRDPDETTLLLNRAAHGDDGAIRQLLSCNRRRLKRFVATRLDPQLVARVDASDVVQDTLIVAHNRFNEYVRSRPISFYPWLRQLAVDRLIELHRRHVTSQRRSVRREALPINLPDDSALALVNIATDSEVPERRMMRNELRRRVTEILACLTPVSREALIMRFVEQLSTRESAEALGISIAAFQGRQFRAIAQFRRHLSERGEELP